MTSSVFCLLDSLLYRPLPVKNPTELVSLRDEKHPVAHTRLTTASFRTLRNTEMFGGVAAYATAAVDLSSAGEPIRLVNAIYVSDNYFTLLGVNPMVGSPLRDGDGSAPHVLLAYDFWRSEFGGSANIIGAQLSIGRRPFVVVGVTQPGFFGLEIGRSFQIALPLDAYQIVNAGAPAGRRDL